MATSKGHQMLGMALKSKKRAIKKRGLVADAVGAYKTATGALQNAGKQIGTGIKNAVNTRITEQNNWQAQQNAGNNKNYYATAASFKRKRAKKRSAK